MSRADVTPKASVVILPLKSPAKPNRTASKRPGLTFPSPPSPSQIPSQPYNPPKRLRKTNKLGIPRSPIRSNIILGKSLLSKDSPRLIETAFPLFHDFIYLSFLGGV